MNEIPVIAAPATTIHRPDASPLKLGLANLLVGGGLGYWLLGQRKKAVQAWLFLVLGSFFTCGTAYVFAFVTAYDAYLLGQRLQLGETIGIEQHALPFLALLFR